MRRTVAVSRALGLVALSIWSLGAVRCQVGSAATPAGGYPADGPDAYRDAGWHFGIGFGTLAWGQASRCACAAVSLDVAVAYESRAGIGVEYKPTLTNTTAGVVEQSVNLVYFPQLTPGLGAPFGIYAGAGLLLPLNDFSGQETGSSYGYGLRARAALGRRGRTRVFGDIGVAVFRQGYEFQQDWRDFTFRERQVHSGPRVRVGVVW